MSAPVHFNRTLTFCRLTVWQPEFFQLLNELGAESGFCDTLPLTEH